jgi:hypothetical protein
LIFIRRCADFAMPRRKRRRAAAMPAMIAQRDLRHYARCHGDTRAAPRSDAAAASRGRGASAAITPIFRRWLFAAFFFFIISSPMIAADYAIFAAAAAADYSVFTLRRRLRLPRFALTPLITLPADAADIFACWPPCHAMPLLPRRAP